MASVNTSHDVQSGGCVLFQGELILLFCDGVQLSVKSSSGSKQSTTGRVFLTTHRVIFTSNNNPSLRSFSLPFMTVEQVKLEQPIFGANYISGRCAGQAGNEKFWFEMRFNKGGACEFGQALDQAARQAKMMSTRAPPTGWDAPPPYAEAPPCYEAPPTVYQPAYNVGFAVPTHVFPTPPPPGFVFASEAPPPYPGLGPQTVPATAPQPMQYPGQYPGQFAYPTQPYAPPRPV